MRRDECQDESERQQREICRGLARSRATTSPFWPRIGGIKALVGGGEERDERHSGAITRSVL